MVDRKIPMLTPEQRAAALEKARQSRTIRKEAKEKLARSEERR